MKGITVIIPFSPLVHLMLFVYYSLYLYAELSRTLRVVSGPPHAVIMIAVAVGNV